VADFRRPGDSFFLQTHHSNKTRKCKLISGQGFGQTGLVMHWLRNPCPPEADTPFVKGDCGLPFTQAGIVLIASDRRLKKAGTRLEINAILSDCQTG
jgi:hypothetical protein